MKKKLAIFMLAICLMAESLAPAAPALAKSRETTEAESSLEESSTAEETSEEVETEVPTETEIPTETEVPTETETETTKEKKKKKKGNCDDFIGLGKNYWVLGTAKCKVAVFKEASKTSGRLGTFTKNNCIVINTKGMKKGKKYSWLRVYLKNKKIGYVRRNNLTLGALNVKNFGVKADSKQNQQRIKICQFGLPYIGTKFVLGGKSLTKGIDCSTFARTALRNAGVMVSNRATARVLATYGKAITRAELKPADLVFYWHSARQRYIGHVAIYIGDGYIINASGAQGHVYPSGGIRFAKIDYRTPTAQKFRNLVGN